MAGGGGWGGESVRWETGAGRGEGGRTWSECIGLIDAGFSCLVLLLTEQA